jgi:hypothetical protein
MAPLVNQNTRDERHVKNSQHFGNLFTTETMKLWKLNGTMSN